MADTNPAVVDAAITEVVAKPDTVSLPATEAIRLRLIEHEFKSLSTDTANSFIDRDLGLILDQSPLVPGTSSQLLKLWRDDFEAKRVDGRWVVTAKAGGSVSEVVKARLATTEFSHFVKAGSRGGAGGDATRAADQGKGEPPRPGSLDAVSSAWREQQSRFGEMGLRPRARNGG